MICKICNCDITYKSNAFSWHLKLKHNLSSKEYYDLYLKKEDEDKCKCCGNITKFDGINDGYRTFCSYKCSNNDIGINKKRSKNISYTLKNKTKQEQIITRNKQILSIVKQHFNCDDFTAQKYIEDNKIINAYQLYWIKDKCNTEDVRKKISIAISKYQQSITEEKRNEISKLYHNTCMNRYGKCVFSHNYLYKNIKFNSSWELAYYIWLKDNKVDFEYQLEPIPYKVENKTKYYIPDFRVNGCIIEIKNTYLLNKLIKGETEKHKAKYKCMLENNVLIISKTELYPVFKYIERKYGKNYLKQFSTKNKRNGLNYDKRRTC